MARKPSGQTAVKREAGGVDQIRRYVERLSNFAEKVTQIEPLFAVAAEREGYAVWDVRTDKGSWWVIGPPLNFYAQDLVPSLDYALDLHRALFGHRCGDAPRH